MGVIVNRRRVYGGRKLPYDAEVEYLESTRSQYINIPVGFLASADEVFAVFSMNLGQNEDKYMVASVPWNTNGNKYGLGVHRSKYCIAYDNIATGSTIFGPTYNSDIHEWHYKNNVVTITDLAVSRGKIYASVVSNNIRLFYGFDSGTAGKFVLYKHLRNGVVLINLIPVRVGTTGYMYDKVSGKLFGNDGTGEFVLGPDIMGGKSLVITLVPFFGERRAA